VISFPRALNSTAYPVMFHLVLSIDHTSDATGKTPTLTRSKNGGAFNAGTGAVSEVGSGWYSWAGNATDRDTLGPLALHVTATGCDTLDFIIPITTSDPFAASASDPWGIAVPAAYSVGSAGYILGNNLDATVSSRTSAALTAAALNVQSPVIDADSLTLEQADDYYATEGRSFIFTYTGTISLAGATVVLRIDQMTATGVVAGAVPAQTITFQPTAAQTSALAGGIHRFKVRATLSNGHVVTLGRGTVDVGADT
jgi:hypothetical protein